LLCACYDGVLCVKCVVWWTVVWWLGGGSLLSVIWYHVEVNKSKNKG
jgi:hypothetical protein